MTEDNANRWIHQDVVITVDGKGRFRYMLDDQGHYQASLSAAQEAITKYKFAEVQAQTIALNCVTREGEPFMIRGVNRSTSNVLTTPPDVHSTPDAYVDTPLIRTMIARAIELETASKVIRERLRKATISTYGYGRIRAEDYAARIERLLANYEEATEHAKTLEQSDA